MTEKTWYTAKEKPGEVVFRRVLEPEVIRTKNGKTVVDEGNYLVNDGKGIEEYTPKEFNEKYEPQ